MSASLTSIVLPSLEDFDPRHYFMRAMVEAGLELTLSADQVEVGKWREALGPVVFTNAFSQQVLVGFTLKNNSYWSLIGRCSVCTSEGCAHVFALANVFPRSLLKRWQRDLERGDFHHHVGGHRPDRSDSADAALQQWLQIRAAGPEASPGQIPDLIFCLCAAPTAQRRLVLLSAIAPTLKGRDVRSKPRFLGEVDGPSRPHLGTPAYHRYAAFCASNFSTMEDGCRWSSMIDDKRGVHLLQLMANADLLFAVDEDTRPVGPLHFGEQRRLDWSWQEHDRSHWRVSANVEGGGDAYFGRVPLFVDSKALGVGLLDLDGMTREAADLAAVAPPIPKAWIAQQSRSSRAIDRLPRPPAFVADRSARVLRGPPVPVLTVALLPTKEIFSLDLAFRYGEIVGRFALSDKRVHFFGAGRDMVEVVRDLEAETRAVAAMAALGLQRDESDGQWRFSGDRADQRRGFRSLLESDFAALRDAGFEIVQEGSWDKVQRASQIHGGVEEGTTPGLQLSMGFELEGERVNLLPLMRQVVEALGGSEGIRQAAAEAEDGGVVDERPVWVLEDDGRWVGLPRAQLLPWLAVMVDILDSRSIAALRAPSLSLSRIEALRLEADAPDLQLRNTGASAVKELLAAKSNTDPLAVSGLGVVLEPFQCAGVRWMTVLTQHDLGGLLGDEPGLGKTVQCLAHLLDLKNRGDLTQPALVVAVPAQVQHWVKHVEKVAPCLRTGVLHGTGRHELLDRLQDFDVVITTWDTIPRDVQRLAKQSFRVAYLDETERLHNHGTVIAKAVRTLNIRSAIALNGSPVENSFSDLWSVLDVVLKGLLDTEAAFKRHFLTPIEDSLDKARLRLLRTRLAPFMLRRLQRDSSVTLPPLRHQDVVLRIKGQQANLYESVRATTVEGVREVLDAGSISGAQKGRILGILTQLRQVCTDPRLTSLGRARSITESAKFSWIQENLPRLVSEGRRVLVVCFFSEFFDLLGPWLRQQSITFSMIRSGVTDRERQKEAFKEGRAQVFLLGLKSGGRGLDLPEADVVLHLDPWWNPQAHAQATARAHRMGQTKSVLVMRLLIEGSLEERVLEIQDRKRQFASALDDVTLLDESKISEDDIRTMLLPMRDVEE